jgi:hypothetical protein
MCRVGYSAQDYMSRSTSVKMPESLDGTEVDLRYQIGIEFYVTIRPSMTVLGCVKNGLPAPIRADNE